MFSSALGGCGPPSHILRPEFKTPVRWEKSGLCSVFHSVPCHLFLSTGLFWVLTELNGHRSQVLWMLFIHFSDENGLALFSIVLHPQRFGVVFRQTLTSTFDLFSVYKWPPALASPLLSLATSVIYSMYVWSGKHDFQCLKLQSPALLPWLHTVASDPLGGWEGSFWIYPEQFPHTLYSFW